MYNIEALPRIPLSSQSILITGKHKLKIEPGN